MQCEMTDACKAPVTHIGEKGYVYCGPHAEVRRQAGSERTRKMRAWECALIEAGEPVPSYKPGPKPVTDTAKLRRIALVIANDQAYPLAVDKYEAILKIIEGRK